MSIRVTAIAASFAVLAGAGATDLYADPAERNQPLETLRQMITPSPEAEQAYAIALAIWQRESASPAPDTPRQ